MSKVSRMDGITLSAYAAKFTQKGFFYAWSRAASDSFRKKLHQLLGEEFGYHYREDLDPCGNLNALPEVDWSDLAFDDALCLTQLRALYSKDEDMLSVVDKEAAAFKSFQMSESSCYRVNNAISDGSLTVDNSDAACVLLYAQRKISSILGDVPDLDQLDYSFGPGASVTCRKNTTARFKLSTPPSITNLPHPEVISLLGRFPHWAALHKSYTVCDGELQFVPKTWKTYRSIVIEPTVNGMYQRAIGSFLKQKLLGAGVDLRDQSINRRRALEASRNPGSLATIDLSRASDSIAYNLVAELLPLEWFLLLDRFRTPCVRYQNSVIRLEKFSSMGNGFTFELESLLFFSIGFGLAHHFGVPFDLTVYGDDLVCGTALAKLLIQWLPVFGFTPNSEKSFLSGDFYESCGLDCFKGVDVRPFFIRDRVCMHTVFCAYNFYVRKPWFDPSRRVRSWLLSLIPQDLQLWGPDGYGDGHLVSTWEISRYAKRHGARKGFCGYTFQTFQEVPYRVLDEMPGDALLPIYTAQKARGDGMRIPDGVCGPKVPLGSQYIKGWLLSALSDVSSGALDHYVVRRPSHIRRRCRTVRIYVLGDAPCL